MPTYGDQAVVLRKLDYGEADRIYTLLTRRHGKVGAIARGVRKTASRLAGGLELYAVVEVELATGRNLDVVTQVVRASGRRLAADVERTTHAALIAEVADRVSEDRHPVEGLFELTSLALDDLAQEPEPRRSSAYFLAQALELLGWAPNLAVCAACDRPLAAEPAAFAAPAGGFVCGPCSAGVAGLLPVSSGGLKVLRVMAAGDIGLYRRLRLSEDLLAEIEGVLESLVEHNLERRLRSLQFMRRMRGAARPGV